MRAGEPPFILVSAEPELLLHLTASPHLKVASGETFFDQLDQSAPFPGFSSEMTGLSEAFASHSCSLVKLVWSW